MLRIAAKKESNFGSAFHVDSNVRRKSLSSGIRTQSDIMTYTLNATKNYIDYYGSYYDNFHNISANIERDLCSVVLS